MWLFYHFDFERSYDILKPKRPCFLLYKKLSFNKNETETEMETSTHAFRETNLVLQLIQESQIKSKTVISWSFQRKKGVHFL